MKIIANDYSPQEILKMIREYCSLTQEEFGKSIYRSGRSIRAYEGGERHITLETLLFIAKVHKFKIIIEKEVK